MTYTKEEVVKVLKKALKEVGYLNGEHNWFCTAVNEAAAPNRSLSEFIKDEFIYPSIGERVFLTKHLRILGHSFGNNAYKSEEYKTLAFAHWNNLIDEIKSGKHDSTFNPTDLKAE